MGAVARQLYRAVAKVVREYARAGVALPHLPTSLLSAVLPPPSLAALRATPSRQQPLADLRAAFRAAAATSDAGQAAGLDVGFLALRRISARLRLLQGAEDSSEAITHWAGWLGSFDQAQASAAKLAEAAEQGALLHYRLTHPPASHYLLEEEREQTDLAIRAEVSWARERLDELAEAVRAEHPDMYDEYGQLPAAAADGGEAAHSRCLVDLRKVLFQDQGFKGTQPEFLYDGLRAVVLPEVLRHKAGTPVALGMVMLCVARRVGLPLVGAGAFLTASSFVVPGDGDAFLDNVKARLPTELASRLEAARRASLAAAGPELGLCMLHLATPYSPGGAAAPTHYINPYDGGAAITEAHCHALALKAGYRVSREALRQTASPAQWCAAMVRVTILASQRKGDGDATAYWLYQLLALDPDTREWGAMNEPA